MKASRAPISARYLLCGVELEVNVTDEVVARLIGSRLRSHLSSSSAPPSVVFDILGREDASHAVPPPGPGRPIYDAPGGQVVYYAGPDELYVDYAGALSVLCRPAAGLVSSVIQKDEPGRVLAAYPFFTIPLLEVMKRQERYALHAACVALGGRGLLLAGAGGSGKSTLTLALARAGWDFLSDDMVFLRTDGRGLKAWGFSDEVDASDRTVAMFPELRGLVGRPALDGRDKHPVDVAEVFAAARLLACTPAALVFPTLSGERKSELKPVPASFALRQLAPNVLLTEPAATQAHLDVLAELASAVPCYALSTGSDLDNAARCLQEAFTAA